jgi:hypothetical protein
MLSAVESERSSQLSSYTDKCSLRSCETCFNVTYFPPGRLAYAIAHPVCTLKVSGLFICRDTNWVTFFRGFPQIFQENFGIILRNRSRPHLSISLLNVEMNMWQQCYILKLELEVTVLRSRVRRSWNREWKGGAIIVEVARTVSLTSYAASLSAF